MIPAVSPDFHAAAAEAGLYRFVTDDDLVARSLTGSLYDAARTVLDRLTTDGAFAVTDYTTVQGYLARTRTGFPRVAEVRAARAALMEQAPFHRFVLSAEADPETGQGALVVTGYTSATPEAAARVAWDFYAGWLAEHRPLAAAVSFSVRSE